MDAETPAADIQTEAARPAEPPLPKRIETAASLPQLDLNSLLRAETLDRPLHPQSTLPPGTLTILSDRIKRGILEQPAQISTPIVLSSYGDSNLAESLLPSLDDLPMSPMVSPPMSPSSPALSPDGITATDHTTADDAGLVRRKSSRKRLLHAYRKPNVPGPDDKEDTRKSRTLAYSTTIALISSLGGLCFGYEVGVVNQLLGMPSFRTYFGLGSSELNVVDTEGNIVTMFLIGTIPGGLATAFVSDYIGRKWSVALGGFFHMIGGFIQTASLNLATLYVGRLISGLGVGLLSGSVPMYISETSPKETRGRGVNFDQFMITVGILLSNIANVILVHTIPPDSDLLWRIALLLQVCPAILLLSLLYFVPESPRYYIRKGYYTKAMDIIARCNGETITSDTTLQLFEEILESIESEAKAERFTRMQRKDSLSMDLDGHNNCALPCLGDSTVGLMSSSNGGNGICGPTGDRWRVALGSKCYRKRIMLGMTLFFFQQWSGINTVMYYSSALFVGMGLPFDLSANVATTIQAGINVIFTIPAFWMVDRVGRRNLLLYGAVAMSLAMASATLWVQLFETTTVYDPDLGYYAPDPLNYTGRVFGALGLMSIYLYVASFAMTWGPVGWVYVSEIYPLRVRSIGIGLATTSHWVNNAIIAKVWPYIYADVSGWQYMIFAITCLVAFVWVWFFVKETSGLDLEEMDALFGVDPDIQQFNNLARQAVRRSSINPHEFVATSFPSQFKDELKQVEIDEAQDTLQRKLEYEQRKLMYGTISKKSYYQSLDYDMDEQEVDESHSKAGTRPPSPASSVGSVSEARRSSVSEWPRPMWATPITKPLGSVAALPLPAPLPAQFEADKDDTLSRHGDTLTRHVRSQELRDEEEIVQVKSMARIPFPDARRESTSSIRPPSLAPSACSATFGSIGGDVELPLGMVARLSVAERGTRSPLVPKPRRPSLISVSSLPSSAALVPLVSATGSWRRSSAASSQSMEGGYDSLYGEAALEPARRPSLVPELIVSDTLTRNTISFGRQMENEYLHPEQQVGIVKANMQDIMHDE